MAPPMKFSRVHKESDEPEAPSNNLWVGNLAPDVTDSDLMDLFAKYGALDSVTTYSSRSYAFLYFKHVEDAAAAKDALQGTLLRGNPVKIEFARPAKPSKNLWVGGISPAVSKEQLEEEFLKFGKIEEFKFLRDRNTAFIEYVKLEDALEAMRSMNGKRLGGDQIRVDFLRSQSVRREQLPEFRDSRDSQFSVAHSGVRRFQHSQTSGGRKEGPPSNVLWVGYPPSVQIDEQMLHNAMILFGEIERIKSFPARHYSFVEFRSVDEARRAKEGLQGRLFNDPRISIMYSSSELAPGKEYSSFNAGGKGPRPEIFNENLFGSNQLEVLDHHRPMGLHTLSGPLPPSNIRRPNLQLRPFGPQGSFDPVLSGAEFNDLAPLHSFRDGNSNIPTGPNWRRPSPPASGILPSPASRVRPPMRSVSTGWDVLDPSQYQREPKRSRLDASLPIDEDAFPSRNRFGPPADAGISGPFVNVQGKRSASPVGGRAAGGPHQHRIDHDFIWRGIIAKGGTPVCNARCVPLDKGMDLELPEVVNCSARTGLDMLTKHYAEAIGFDIVFFLPDSEDDFASYTEFLRYLGSKNRAGVAKFDDGTTLFLVPPSDFLTNVLKVKGPERLYGVVLKLPQQTPSSASIQPQLCQPNHIPQYMDRHQIPPPEIDYNQIARKEERFTPMDYNRILHEDSKPPSKIFYPPATESMTEQSVHQAYASNSTVAVSQAGVSWTPELIASLTSLLPANAQLSTLEGGQPVSGSLVVDKRTLHGWKHSGNTSHMQYGSQFNSESQAPLLSQPYPSISSAPNSSEIMVPGTAQIQDFSVNLPHQGGIASRPLNSVNLPSQGGQVALPPHVSQQYQLEVPHQKAYSGMMHGTEGSYSPSVIQQSNNPVVFSSQAQGGNHSQTQSGLPLSSDKVNWEVSSQLQTAPFVADQGTSEVEVDKNQRYQSTLQFAASLLLQIQQQQQQQTGNPAVRGSGNQQ
ncbi:flowering time control protein FPA isoform X2 [Ricinus communis]|uniref:flowering time control protein FPA isoform X2 n=1 Tax=Ricinus communis TaxID=3988 RepID=UPI0007729247|nr:flowering time control protein FPA isoform X2 [Ricinus communis]|eukprot:XP_015581056.1 flowering time control protein FPA isoform X2 [Ricinus communis]